MGMATTTKAETVQFAAIIKWAIVESGLMATAIECRRNMCKWRIPVSPLVLHNL
jgi:hypothetical protein